MNLIHHPRAHQIAIGALAFLIVILIAPVWMRAAVASSLYSGGDSLPHTDAILILGASVVHGAPSALLQARADAAIELYNAGVAKKIIVTGDNGEKNYDEVTPVRTYLMSKGVPSKDIFLDHFGFDTYSSMYRARSIFGARSLMVVSQDFHLPRAVYLGKQFGIDASGYTVEDGNSMFQYIREIAASWKAFFDLAMHREPKYLGAPIPLIGDGAITMK